VTTDIEAQLVHARRTAQFLMRLGWSVWFIGVASVVVTCVFFVLDDISADEALMTIFGTALATILSGAVAYGSAVNIDLGASRLELAAKHDD
jgi:hypothetical protein